MSLHVTASGGLAGRKKILTSANERFLRAPPGLGLPSRPAAEPSSAGPGAPSSPALWGRSPPGARGRFQPHPAGFGFQPSRASHHLQQCSLRHVHNHRLEALGSTVLESAACSYFTSHSFCLCCLFVLDGAFRLVAVDSYSPPRSAQARGPDPSENTSVSQLVISGLFSLSLICCSRSQPTSYRPMQLLQGLWLTKASSHCSDWRVKARENIRRGKLPKIQADVY